MSVKVRWVSMPSYSGITNKGAQLFALTALYLWAILGANAASPYQQAAACMEAQDFAGALAHSKKGFASAKTLADKIGSLSMMADAAGALHQYPVVIQAMNQAISLIGKSNSTFLRNHYWRRGKAYFAYGNYDKAVADFSAVDGFQKSPRDVVNLMRDRSLAYEKLHEYNKSVADLTTGLKSVDAIVGVKADAIMISRVKGEKIQLLYQRAKDLQLAGKVDDAKRDKVEADRLSEDF